MLSKNAEISKIFYGGACSKKLPRPLFNIEKKMITAKELFGRDILLSPQQKIIVRNMNIIAATIHKKFVADGENITLADTQQGLIYFYKKYETGILQQDNNEQKEPKNYPQGRIRFFDRSYDALDLKPEKIIYGFTPSI